MSAAKLLLLVLVVYTTMISSDLANANFNKLVVVGEYWDQSTTIYQVKITKAYFELNIFAPTADLSKIQNLKSLKYQLADLLQADQQVQDLAVVIGHCPILLVLTTDQQLLALSVEQLQIYWKIALTPWLGAANAVGSKLYGRCDRLQCDIVVMQRALPLGALWGSIAAINLSKPDPKFNMQFIAAPATSLDLLGPIKVLHRQQLQIYSGVKTAAGIAIWQLSLNDQVGSNKLYQTKAQHLQDFILLRLPTAAELAAIAVYDQQQIWILAVNTTAEQLPTTIVSNLAASAAELAKPKIMQLAVGTALKYAPFSWYMLAKVNEHTILTSNNFKASIVLPKDSKMFLRYGCLVVCNMLHCYSVDLGNGDLQKLKLLARQAIALSDTEGDLASVAALPAGVAAVAAVDSEQFNSGSKLLWSEKLHTQVLLCWDKQQLVMLQFKLAFDTPKRLSWRLEDRSGS